MTYLNVKKSKAQKMRLLYKGANASIQKGKLLLTQKLIHFVVLSRLCLVVISLKEPNQTFYCINYVVQKAL